MPLSLIDAEAMVLPLGKHVGKTLGEIIEKDREYFVWVALESHFLRTFDDLSEAVVIVAMANGITKPERVDPNQQQLFQP